MILFWWETQTTICLVYPMKEYPPMKIPSPQTNYHILNKVNHAHSMRITDKSATILDHVITDLVKNCSFNHLLGESGKSDYKYYVVGMKKTNSKKNKGKN